VDIARIQQQIESGLSALHLAGPQGLAGALVGYLELLSRWNETYNLTAVRAPEDMVTRHLMDSLAVLPFLGEGRTLDVGTGAGLPGLVLAMACPGQHLRAAGFLRQEDPFRRTRGRAPWATWRARRPAAGDEGRIPRGGARGPAERPGACRPPTSSRCRACSVAATCSSSAARTART
jgi:hypothetical protein